MRVLAGSELLLLWERGASRHALDRSALLAAAARPDWPADSIADLPLGVVNASLLQLRAACFGAAHRRPCRLPDSAASACRLRWTRASCWHRPMAPSRRPREAEVAGLRVRPPSLRDLAAVATEARCRTRRTPVAGALHPGGRCRATGRCGAAGRRGKRWMRWIRMPTSRWPCSAWLAGTRSLVQLDAGQLLWDEIEARAQVLLHEVHTLASAYGWSEAQILALTPARRASYLAMVGAA